MSGYISAASSLYGRVPKMVWANIALSMLAAFNTASGTEEDPSDPEGNAQRVLAEWWVLYQNEIVTQKPPRALNP